MLYFRVLQIELTKQSDVAMWSIIEPCVGIVAGSLPYFGSLYPHRPSAKTDLRLLTPVYHDGDILVKYDVGVGSEIRSPTPEPLGNMVRCNGRWPKESTIL